MVVRMRDPFAALAAVQRAMDSVTGGDWLGTRTAGAGAYPPVNVFNDGEDWSRVLKIAEKARELIRAGHAYFNGDVA